LVAVKASRTEQELCMHGVTSAANCGEQRQNRSVTAQPSLVAAAKVQFA
jgi:hypothetical protein